MGNIIGWIIIIVIGLSVAFIFWRTVTARYRAGRKMLERLSRKELEGLNQDMLKRDGLEGVYKDVLKQREAEELHILNEWAKRDSVGKPYNLKVVKRDKQPEKKDKNNAGTTKIQ